MPTECISCVFCGPWSKNISIYTALKYFLFAKEVEGFRSAFRKKKITHVLGLSYSLRAGPCFRRFVVGFSEWKALLSTREIYVRSVMEKVALEQGFLRKFRLTSVSIISALLHTNLYSPYSLLKTDGRNLWIFQKNEALSNNGENWTEMHLLPNVKTFCIALPLLSLCLSGQIFLWKLCS
jgi:hypothetical protein